MTLTKKHLPAGIFEVRSVIDHGRDVNFKILPFETKAAKEEKDTELDKTAS